jgi:site-specific recombinase XerD
LSPKANNNEGTTPAPSDAPARALLKAPPVETLKGIRDRAILATLLFHDIRREGFCTLRVRDYQRREGIMHFRVEGKGDKVRFIPVATEAQRLIHI